MLSYFGVDKLFPGLPTATAKTPHNFCSGTAKTLHNSCSDTAAILHTFCSVTAKQLQCHCKGVAAALQKECSDSAKGMRVFAVSLSAKQGTTYRDTPILISNHLFSFDISELRSQCLCLSISHPIEQIPETLPVIHLAGMCQFVQ